MENRFSWPVRPAANENNTVCGENYRITVLTSRLLRMEYTPTGLWEDRASQAVFYRDFPACDFQVSRQEDWLHIETEHLQVSYLENALFACNTLTVKLKQEPASMWHYGDDFEDLGGTTKTLDEVDGGRPVGRGVVSRNGFSVLDDSDSMLLDETGWVAVREKESKDIYFFGYGFDYLAAVQDYYRLTGIPPMLPNYALGNWWSRYYAYEQQEYLDLMDRFRQEDIPIAVSVVDMDWHVTQIPEDKLDEEDTWGWTGYSWNKELFPDYKAFLKELKKRNLKVTLNLHPHSGVRRHEDMYEEMARACGVDPASGKRIPLDILSPSFMEKYFDILHHPYEKDGVDFWWMDWQQGTDYGWIHEKNREGKMQDEREVLDPLWMLNHLHILDISRNGKRPMFFSRFSGPGSQRYPVGFSGDSFVTWESLQFQPYFTATASNIGYCWWSHDIGGHQRGWRDDEMFVRWVQLGVFSPINRLHSSCNNFQRKEPWSYGKEAEGILKDYLRLRHQLFPYIYTMNYRVHNELQPLVQPMYYSHPKCSGAYDVPNQYWFGSEMIVAPITEKRAVSSNYASAEVWLPAGNWFDLQTGLHYASLRGRKMKAYRDLEHMPVFAKAGAIVPMAVCKPCDNHLGNCEEMQVLVFPGDNNSFTLYEDAGDGDGYQKGEFAKTKMTLRWDGKKCFTIHPAEGDTTLIPQRRKWKLCFRGFVKNLNLTVLVDGSPVAAKTEYDPDANTTMIFAEASVASEISVTIGNEQPIHDNGDVLKRCEQVLQLSQLSIQEKTHIMTTISDRERSLHHRIYGITGRYEQAQPVVGVLRELLTLTEDEFLGKQMR